MKVSWPMMMIQIPQSSAPGSMCWTGPSGRQNHPPEPHHPGAHTGADHSGVSGNRLLPAGVSRQVCVWLATPDSSNVTPLMWHYALPQMFNHKSSSDDEHLRKSVQLKTLCHIKLVTLELSGVADLFLLLSYSCYLRWSCTHPVKAFWMCMLFSHFFTWYD